MKNILIPIDFSRNSINAAYYGAALASYTNSTIMLFHSYDIPVEIMDNYGFVNEEERLKIENMELLEDVAEDLMKIHPSLSIKWTTSLGDLPENVKGLVKAYNINLVVMGTKGASGLKEIFMGSNTSNIIENVDCAVLAIPENAKFSPLKKIFYATDFHIEDFVSINKLCTLSHIFNAEVIVGHISTGNSREKDLELLDWFVELAGPKLCCGNIRFSIKENNSFFDGINEAIEEEGIDLLSVSTVKKAFFDKIFGISHTKKLSCHLRVPMLAFHLGKQ